MKYHSDECCRRATNKRIMQMYYKRKASKAERLGTKRVCKTCDTLLSRYNESDICKKCEAEAITEARDSLMDMIKSVSG